MIELLSPAGSPEAVIAAVQNGADAIYLGLGNFNARRGAKNFSDEEFQRAMRYCRVRGCKVYVTIIRGTPMMVQLLIMGFVIFKSSRDFTSVGALTLGINSGAYVAEIIRGGLMSLDPGQAEAGRSLGLNYFDTMRFVVIPQAFKAILPSLGNEFIMMLKETSLASTFFLGDIMTSYQVVKGATFLTLEPLTIVAIIYLCLTFPLSKIVEKFEKKMASPNSYKNHKKKRINAWGGNK